MYRSFNDFDFFFPVRSVEFKYKAIPGLLSKAKVQAKSKRCPATRSNASINEEHLFSSLRSWIAAGNPIAELSYTRRSKQTEYLEKFKEG